MHLRNVPNSRVQITCLNLHNKTLLFTEQTGCKPVQKRFRDETGNGSPVNQNKQTNNSNKNDGVKEVRTVAANEVLKILKKSHLKLVMDMENLSISLVRGGS